MLAEWFYCFINSFGIFEEFVQDFGEFDMRACVFTFRCQSPEVEKFVFDTVKKMSSKAKKTRRKKGNVLRRISSKSATIFKRQVNVGRTTSKSAAKRTANSKAASNDVQPSTTTAQTQRNVISKTLVSRKRSIDDILVCRTEDKQILLCADDVNAVTASTMENTLDKNNNSSRNSFQPEKSILVKKRRATSVKKSVRFA